MALNLLVEPPVEAQNLPPHNDRQLLVCHQANKAWWQQWAQVPVTWRPSLPRILGGGDHPAQQSDIEKGELRDAGAVTCTEAGVYSGRANQKKGGGGWR